MVLVLDPLVREKVSPPPGSRPPQDSPTSDPEVIPSCPRQRCDSGQSDRSTGSFGRRPSRDSPCSERSGQRESASASSTDSEVEPEKDPRPTPQPSADAPDGAALSTKAPPGSSGLPNGLRDRSTEQVCVTRDAPLTTLTNGKETGSSRVAAPLARPNSIRDRMRKFTEPAHAEAPPPRRGLQRSVRPLSAHLGDRAGRPEPQAPKSPSPAALGQSQKAVGGTGRPGGGVDAGVRSQGGSPQPESPETGRAVTASHGEPEAQTQDQPPETQDPADDMKTFLTIEIKDGRTTINQPQTRTITHHASAVPQRSELTLGLRATPFKISTQSISTGPSFKLDSEPAMFVVEPSVPNGSSSKSLTSDQSRSSSTAARSQERTIRVVQDQSHASHAPARVQEHAITVMADQSNASPAPARVQEHTIKVMADQSHASPAPARVQEHAIKVMADQSHASSTSTQAKAQSETRGKMTAEQLEAIDDELLLDKMLDETKDFEERRLIRAAMRDLRKKKRDLREKERDQRLEELRKHREERAQKGKAGELVTKKVEKSADGSTVSQVTKTNRFAQSDDGSRSSRSSVMESSYVQKTDKGTLQSKSYSYSSSSSSSSGKKVGSVFDREDDSATERRQMERRKELMRAQTMPKSTGNQARKAMMEKLDPGGAGNPAVARVNKVQRSTSFGVPNANSIKQMLLDWCRAKTRSYENVVIQNFSTSWCDGMAFCALVHNFFPQAFDYDSLSAANRRHNFQLAFSTAEELADVPCLLDVEDMVGMREPDWKCVYTYLQEFYRGLVLKGLVKTKGSA